MTVKIQVGAIGVKKHINGKSAVAWNLLRFGKLCDGWQQSSTYNVDGLAEAMHNLDCFFRARYHFFDVTFAKPRERRAVGTHQRQPLGIHGIEGERSIHGGGSERRNIAF